MKKKERRYLATTIHLVESTLTEILNRYYKTTNILLETISNFIVDITTNVLVLICKIAHNLSYVCITFYRSI